MDDYLTFVQKYHQESDISKKLLNPVYHVHNGDVPVIHMHGLSFALLLNLASVCNPESKDILWGFISKYAPEATPENSPYLDKLAMHAVCYYNDFIKANKKYKLPTQEEKEILKSLSVVLSEISDQESVENIQNKIYEVGCKSGDLKNYFQMLYEILLGQSEGPRFGSFVSLYGVLNTRNLIDSKIR